MKYITGIHALNIEDDIETCGDWHTSALNWQTVKLIESDSTFYKDWGIESNKTIPEHDGVFNVANSLRAILDLMIDGAFGYLKGFRNDFFCTDKYNKEFFEQVALLRGSSIWADVDKLMKREFMFEWDKFLESIK